VAGGALRFSRSENSFVDFGQVLTLTETSFSISGWVLIPTGESSPVSGVMTKHRPGTGNGYAILFNEIHVPDGANKLACFVGDYGTVEYAVPLSTTPVNDGAWHHFVVVYNAADRIKLYLDGLPMESARAARPAFFSPARLLLGGIDPGNPMGTLTGQLDEFQIYDFELADSEIEFLFSNPGKTVATGLEPLLITPNGGVFSGPVGVTLRSGIQGAKIRFTQDDSEPVLSSTLYQGTLTVTPPVTLKARAFVNGFPVSNVSTARFTPEPDVRIQPAGGTFTNAIDVSLTPRINGAFVRYTLDGTTPSNTSPRVEGLVRLTATSQVRARAFFGEFPVSNLEAADFVRVYPSTDGMPDSWRMQFFGANYASDPQSIANADPDGDGANNLQEFIAGTNPLDPLSGFFVGLRAVPEIRFQSIIGKTYRIFRRVSLPGNPPVLVGTLTATSTNTIFLDILITEGTGFYVVEPLR